MGTFLELPLQDKTMDTIVSCYAFHYCNYDERRLALKEMDRFLKPNGRII
ncbi:class I SAM-dependent methyltransferase [Lacrimispora celerecrescens]